MSANVPLDAIERLSSSVQPLVFETKIEGFPYSISGTVFLAGYEGKLYVVTTRHGLYPDTLDGPPLICVFPSDTSQRLFKLNNVFFVAREDESDDCVDLAIIEVDSTAILDSELNQATLINLALAVEPQWETRASNMVFFVIGCPGERASIDPYSQELRAERVFLLARYKSKSPSSDLHILEVENPQSLVSFGGLSGSPVFMWSSFVNRQPKPILCGMVIRGTVESGLIYFLPISILMDAFKIKRKKHEKK